MNSNKKKSTNPIYVVSNNGVDVEEAKNFLDLLLKKTGVDKLLPILESILSILLSEVKSYPVFIEVKKMFDKLFEQFISALFFIQTKFNSKTL